VETATVLPFVLLLTIGVADIGRAYCDAARVQEAAREGALDASLNPGNPTDAIARAEQVNSTPDLTGAIAVTCPAAEQVTVNVSYNFNLVTPPVGLPGQPRSYDAGRRPRPLDRAIDR
jgi:Flp pilus assembly protein TadG